MPTRVHRLRQCRDLGGGSFALEVDGLVPATAPGRSFGMVTALLDDLLQKTCTEGPVHEACELVE